MAITVPSPPTTEPTATETTERQTPLLRRLGLFLTSVVVLFVLLEGLTRILVTVAQPLQTGAATLDEKYDLAKEPWDTDHPKILLLGDSYVNMGLYPELMAANFTEAGYPVAVRNLGNPGNNVSMILFLLQTAVQSGNQPSAVVVGLNPSAFDPDRVWEPENNLKRSYVGRCHYQPPTGWEGQVDCALQQWSYLFRF